MKAEIPSDARVLAGWYTDPHHQHPMYLNPDETVIETRPHGHGSAVLIIRRADGFQSPFDVYGPGPRPA